MFSDDRRQNCKQRCSTSKVVIKNKKQEVHNITCLKYCLIEFFLLKIPNVTSQCQILSLFGHFEAPLQSFQQRHLHQCQITEARKATAVETLTVVATVTYLQRHLHQCQITEARKATAVETLTVVASVTLTVAAELQSG